MSLLGTLQNLRKQYFSSSSELLLSPWANLLEGLIKRRVPSIYTLSRWKPIFQLGLTWLIWLGRLLQNNNNTFYYYHFWADLCEDASHGYYNNTPSYPGRHHQYHQLKHMWISMVHHGYLKHLYERATYTISVRREVSISLHASAQSSSSENMH